MTTDYSPFALLQSRCMLVMVAVLGCLISFPATAEGMDRVITSIKPVHSLVSAVMAGVGEPYLMVQGTTSPHTFSLRPSDAVRLENAQIIFLVDRSIETSLVKPAHTLGGNAPVFMLSETKGLVLRKFREDRAFETHSHETNHAHEHHEDAGHHAGHGIAHEKDPHPAEGPYDMHVWLDPENAGVMARKIAEVLSEADPDNAAVYAANARTLQHRLDELTAKITTDLIPVRDKSFILLHDAYQYFEARFGLRASGSVMVDPVHAPSAQRIQKLRNKVQELGAVCVFSEPQFSSRLIEVITENTQARVGVLDPLGATIEAGPEAYFTLLHDLATSFRECLAPADH